MSKRDRGLVYSSEAGRMCPGCDEPLEQCRCSQKAAAKGRGNVRVGRETKGDRKSVV